MATRDAAATLIVTALGKVRAALGAVVPETSSAGEPDVVTQVRPAISAALTAAENAMAIADGITLRLAPLVADPTLSPVGREQAARRISGEVNAELRAELAAIARATDAVHAALAPYVNPARPASISDLDLDRAERHVLLELERARDPEAVVAVLVRLADDAANDRDDAMLWCCTRNRRFIRAVLASRDASEHHLALLDARTAQLLGDLAIASGGNEAAARMISAALDRPYSLQALPALVNQYVRHAQQTVPGFVAELTPSGAR